MMRHGFRPAGTPTPEYAAWVQMRSRCLNPRDGHYKNYGGRGITICRRWGNFANFLDDVGLRPSAEYSLDRRDNNAGYFKSNCRWATREEQQRNKRTTKLSEKDAKEIRIATGSQSEIAHRFGISQSSVSRIKSGEFWISRATESELEPA